MSSSTPQNSGLMETQSRDENEFNQYESAATYIKPASKQGGQLSDDSDNSGTQLADEVGQASQAAKQERGEKTAENMRYGQAISEQGVGGFTDPKLNDGGADEGLEKGTCQTRREQGYHGGNEMSKDVGA